MSAQKQDLDDLLRGNAQKQLADFDWDRSRARVLGRLTLAAGHRVRKRPSWIAPVGATLAGAAILMLAAAGLHLWSSADAERDLIEPGYANSDELLASTDPETILPMGWGRLLALNDPSLMPHSIWDQQPVERPNRNQVMENDHENQEI